MSSPPLETAHNLLLPVVPLRDVCLFPEASLARHVTRPANIVGLEIARRTGRHVLALARKDPGSKAAGKENLHAVGTVAELSEDVTDADGSHRVEMDGLRRARVVSLHGSDTIVAEVEVLHEGDPGDEWGSAVETLARYLHAHAELRAFLDKQRRSQDPMGWVNLACQHLPITPTARQKLLEADARERCIKIGRGLDALFRKEQSS